MQEHTASNGAAARVAFVRGRATPASPTWSPSGRVGSRRRAGSLEHAWRPRSVLNVPGVPCLQRRYPLNRRPSALGAIYSSGCGRGGAGAPRSRGWGWGPLDGGGGQVLVRAPGGRVSESQLAWARRSERGKRSDHGGEGIALPTQPRRALPCTTTPPPPTRPRRPRKIWTADSTRRDQGHVQRMGCSPRAVDGCVQ